MITNICNQYANSFKIPFGASKSIVANCSAMVIDYMETRLNFKEDGDRLNFKEDFKAVNISIENISSKKSKLVTITTIRRPSHICTA